MNAEFIRSFALLFSATIALICAVYIYLGSRKKLKDRPQQLEEN